MTSAAHHVGNASMTVAASHNGNGANPHSHSSVPLIYPALHLQPLNDTFAPKQISLAPPSSQNRIKIGRQTNNKTIPQPSNGYFDSKVLSRMHAEVWSEEGKVYIKDVKSSNGTFINNTRLSPEGQESEVFELHNDDLVEFGIDIIGDDNKSILHHKVACRVFLVITAEEALGVRHDFAALYRGGIAGSNINHHLVGPGTEGGLRRGKLNSLGGYGTNGAVSYVSFDHVIQRLQAELQKSRDTAGNLSSLNSSMNDIGENFTGGLPPMKNQNLPYQHMVPPIKEGNDEKEDALNSEQHAHAGHEKARLAEVKALEEQVKETRAALEAHIERLKGLESRVEEHDSVKSNVLVITKQVEEARRELAEAIRQRDTALTSANVSKLASDSREGHPERSAPSTGSEDNEFDDGASMLSVDTITMGDSHRSGVGEGPVGVDEVESADTVGHMSLGDVQDEDEEESLAARLKDHVGPMAPPDGPPQGSAKLREMESEAARRNEELTKRLEAMENQLERALDLGRTLAGQHAESTETVKRLEDRIKTLEAEHQRLDTTTVELKESVVKAASIASSDKDGPSSSIAAALAEGAAGGAVAGGILTMFESKWGTWRDAFESSYQKDRTALLAEREELRRIVLAWDTLNQDVEDLVDGAMPSSSSSVNGDERSSQRTQNATNTGQASASRKRKKKNKSPRGRGLSGSSSIGSAVAGSSITLPDDSTIRLNRELRTLLYTEDFNMLVRDTHSGSASNVSKASAVLLGGEAEAEMVPVEDAGSSEGRRRNHSTSPERSNATSRGAGEGSGASSNGASNAASGEFDSMAPEDMRESVRKRVMMSMARRKKNKWHDGSIHGLDNTASLSMLGAAGVVFVGMTAWILSAKGPPLGGGAGGSWN